MPCVRAPGTGNPTPDPSLTNWSQEITITPTGIFQPTSIDELVAIVKQAESLGMSVHAVGSAWSFNDNFATTGYVVRTDSLGRILGNSMGATVVGETVLHHATADPVMQALTGSAKRRNLVHVEAGIKVHFLNDALEALNIVNGNRQPHGFAVPTLGGSGGQALAGVVSTSTHGGDVNLPPIPDMVQGIHLVAPGGVEFFLQRGGANAIVDTAKLAQTLPCVAGRIVSDDNAFYSVLCSMGRMGIIYSLVVEVRPQFVLEENRFKASWSAVSSQVIPAATNASGTIADYRAQPEQTNRFLQVVILPYVNGSGDRDCFVSLRAERDISTALNPAPTGDLFSWACEQQPLQKSLVVLGIIATADTIAAVAGAAAAAVSWIPIVGEIAAAAAAAAIAVAAAITAALAPLLVPSITIGDWIAAVTNLMTQFGLLGVATDTVNALLSSGLSPHDVTDLGYKIMDTYDYKANCYKARSLEVAFNADDTTYINYINTVFGLIEDFKSQNVLYGGYLSLRFCKESQALLAIERWENNVCIEMSALSGLDSEITVLSAFEKAAAEAGAAIHWGQLNNRTRPDIESVWADTIHSWRETLVRTAAHGKISTFDNDFCEQRGLEPEGVTWKSPVDISYMVPLLLG
ncbi:MAG: FAD-binding protein [Candidatus Eremiobacteraeota bacterium]|nr:FAD-binding protein [Candidatus Eremiobacteraeota bacterium]